MYCGEQAAESRDHLSFDLQIPYIIHKYKGKYNINGLKDKKPKNSTNIHITNLNKQLKTSNDFKSNLKNFTLKI